MQSNVHMVLRHELKVYPGKRHNYRSAQSQLFQPSVYYFGNSLGQEPGLLYALAAV